jgi:ABC-type Fe3+-hydroxamate transport system substrate-binding protein
MPVFTDQAGRSIEITSTPTRIISLVPSQTELLYDLGLDTSVAGITKFCVHPESWYRTKTRVGGTKQADIKIIASLKPDLILANKEENTKEMICELEKNYPVWVSDISNLDEALDMILQVSIITGTRQAGKAIIQTILQNFQTITVPAQRLRTAYLVWQNPYMSVGHDTFIHAMMETAGFTNIFSDQQRYPTITMAELQARQPDLLLLSSEPFPFKQKHIEDIGSQLPGIRILLVDGEMFSWYGSRLQHAPAYFNTLASQIK